MDVPDPRVEVLLVGLESQSPGRNVAVVNIRTGMAENLLSLRLVVGGGEVFVERLRGQNFWAF